MANFDDIKAGTRLRGLDAAGAAEIVQVARFGPDALNLVFRVDGRVGERLLYRGEEAGFELVDGGRSYAFDAWPAPDWGSTGYERLGPCPGLAVWPCRN